jgi:ferredoxin--NADP+ reductase
MVRILKKKGLNASVTWMELLVPPEVSRAEPGQFVVLRANGQGEKIPLPIADINSERGTMTIIFQIAGADTWRLNRLEEGDIIQDFEGPFGRPTDCGAKKVAVVGGGIGSAVAYPVVKKLRRNGAEVHVVVGFRTRDLVILEEEFRAISDKFFLMTNDGTDGRHGLVTEMLQLLIDQGERYDEVIAMGPLVMMKFVAAVTRPYGIKTMVRLNPAMIDCTGLCGGCYFNVDGKILCACVDGPDFDGHKVDFNEAIARSAVCRPFEARACETSRSIFELSAF